MPNPALNRRDLFGTDDNPIMYGPNEPIRGSWPVTVGEEGTGADMTHCDWIVFEVDDPKSGGPEDDGGGGQPDDDDDDTADDDDDDTTDDDDDTTDDDDDFVFFTEDHCPLFSEVVATPTSGQFIEILNPTEEELDLSDLYLSNSPLYYGMVTQDGSVDTNSGAGGYFNAKFPAGTMLGADEFMVVAIGDGAGFNSDYGFDPDFILYSAKAATVMEDAFSGSIKDQGDLGKDGEALMLYKWNGISDLICDCDYVLFGDKSNVVDKTGVSIDGIDADDVESDYNDDTAPADQSLVADAPHSDGESFNRCEEDEGAEEKDGENNGCDPDTHDETSEDLENTWKTLTPPTPGDEADCDGGDDDDSDDDDSDDDDDDDDDDSCGGGCS